MILPSKIDINKSKALERKIEIDNGVALAKQIDSLRETFQKEKEIHDNWYKTSRETILKNLSELEEKVKEKEHEIRSQYVLRIDEIQDENGESRSR